MEDESLFFGFNLRLLDVRENVLYVTYQDANRAPKIGYLDLKSREMVQLVQLRGTIGLIAGVAISPDEEWILYVENDLVAEDLVMLQEWK